MWVFQTESSLSVVMHKDQIGKLLVRSRVEGDIERAIPGANVWDDPNADYRYRAIVTKEEFKAALSQAVDAMDYTSFKAAVPSRARRAAYIEVWAAMARTFGAYVGRTEA